MPAENADVLAHISGGRPGYAVRLFEQPRLLEQRQAWLDELIDLLASPNTNGLHMRFSGVDQKIKKNYAMNCKSGSRFGGMRFIFAAGVTDPITNLDYSARIQKLADKIGLHNARFHVNSVENTLDRIDRNVNPRLALEVLLMDFPIINVIS